MDGPTDQRTKLLIELRVRTLKVERKRILPFFQCLTEATPFFEWEFWLPSFVIKLYDWFLLLVKLLILCRYMRFHIKSFSFLRYIPQARISVTGPAHPSIRLSVHPSHAWLPKTSCIEILVEEHSEIFYFPFYDLNKAALTFESSKTQKHTNLQLLHLHLLLRDAGNTS